MSAPRLSSVQLDGTAGTPAPIAANAEKLLRARVGVQAVRPPLQAVRAVRRFGLQSRAVALQLSVISPLLICIMSIAGFITPASFIQLVTK